MHRVWSKTRQGICRVRNRIAFKGERKTTITLTVKSIEEEKKIVGIFREAKNHL